MKPRHAFLVREPAIIPPLGHPASEPWLVAAPLGQRMQRQLGAEGVAVERVDSIAAAEAAAARTPAGAIVALDSVAFSPAVLRALLASLGGADGRRAVQAALPEGESVKK